MDTITANFYGQIIDCKTQRPLKASVEFIQNGMKIKIKTNEKGEFKLMHISSGNCILNIFSSSHYPLKSKEFIIGSGEILNVILGLKREKNN